MPSKAPTACRRANCGGVVIGGVCSRCGVLRDATAAAHDERRGSARQRGYDARWGKGRRMHLAGEPPCRLCSPAGRITPAGVVGHIVPIRDGGERPAGHKLQIA